MLQYHPERALVDNGHAGFLIASSMNIAADMHDGQ